MLTLSQHHTAIYWFQFALFALLGVGATISTWYVLSKLEALMKIVRRFKTLREPEIIVIESDPYDSLEDENDSPPSDTPETREDQNSAHTLNGPTSALAPIFVSLVCLLTPPYTCQIQPRLQSISDGVFSPIQNTLPKGWEYSPKPRAKKWQHISFDQLWDQPIIRLGGPLLQDGVTSLASLFQNHKHLAKIIPVSRYWHDRLKLERTCLCTRREAEITPPLSYDPFAGIQSNKSPYGNKKPPTLEMGRSIHF